MKKPIVVVLSATIIAAGIFMLGVFLRSGINNLAFSDRQVTVKGLAEREVEANRVIWPIQYSVAGENLTSLYDKITEYNAVIVKFLTSNGIADDEIYVAPPDTYNATANQYNPNARFNYSLTCTVTVTTSKVDTVRSLLARQSELLKDGIPVSNSYINYEYTKLNEIKPDMIAEATKNARGAAQQFAEDSGSKVGKMKTASQGQFSIESSSSDPSKKNVRVVTTIVYYLED